MMTTEKLKNHYGEYKVIDVRDDAEYNGKQLFNEKAGGHLPGAIHLRYADLFYADGTLRPVKELTKWFENAGLEKNRSDRLLLHRRDPICIHAAGSGNVRI